ncbi:RIP metalloprotease RseP [Candidatus Parcubacteria bacterium]|nr:MAG: RIP metalloprotease RseP [Candidatus Parcubacteria bacterium]
MITVLLFILILGVLVIAHEFGHFITARMSGMKVYEFGFGYPPRVFSFYRDPETKKIKIIWGKGKSNLKKTVSGDEQQDEFPGMLWSINLLPIGGFVRIKGENGEEAQDPDSFGAHKAWKRIVVLVAGVTMNVILAGIVLGVGFMIGLPTDMSQGVDKHAQVLESPSIIVQQVQPHTPAEEAGVKFGDKILRVGEGDTEWTKEKEWNGESVDSMSFISFVNEREGEEISLVIARGEEEFITTLVPEVFEGEEVAKIGVALADAGIVRYPWFIAIYKGFVAAVFGLMNIFIAFYYLIKNLMLGQGLLFDVAGPVGIANIVGQSAKLGINYLLNVTAMLSLSLAAINILPIPALDGGRILFILIEKIIRRPVPIKYEQLAHTIGFMLLMLLVVVVTWRDVVGLF